MMDVSIFCTENILLPYAKKLSDQLQLVMSDQKTSHFSLVVAQTGLSLALNEPHAPAPVMVDFVGGQARHRREFGGGKGQLIAKAVGLKKYPHPSVLDVTAGLGKDAFVLACLGCSVTMVERSNIIAALLRDGLLRLECDPSSAEINLNLIEQDAIEYLKTLCEKTHPDIIYLDPMFPEREKSALVKKEMRFLKEIVGDDPDADQLLAVALTKARKRVVVKRPRLAPALSGPEPNVVYSGKAARYDVYTLFPLAGSDA